MYIARRLKKLPCLVLNKTTHNCYSKSAAVSAKINETIKIPDRIQRSTTDILQALASTVARDHTAAHYKYHDDPYLIPTSNVAKRTYAMAQESGRKAAKWIREEHRDLFLHQEAQPPIKDFAPKMVFNENSEVDAQTLKDLIAQVELTDAVFVYKLLQSKSIEVSDDLKQSLLEMVCFYNNKEPLPDEYIEERWFQSNNSKRERYRNTWQNGDLAEQLFNEIEPKTAESYAALIRGMAKFYQSERAYALFQEAMDKQYELDTETFNCIISNAGFLKDTADQRWELCRDLLHQMSQQKLKPNLYTLNALLECISGFSNFKFARGITLKVLAEFKRLDVTPSLGTYYYVLIIFCRERGPTSHVLVDILNDINEKQFKIAHPKDTYFFATAMDVCRNHLHDKNLAKKVNTLLHKGNNYDLIGDINKESVYYRNYFALLCQTETIDDFMQTYDLLVPNIYVPEPGIMEEFLKAIEVNGAIDIMPRIWSDMVIFDHINRESLIVKVLKILEQNKPNLEIREQQELPEKFTKIALDIYHKIEDQPIKRARKISFTGQMIGNILCLVVRGGDFENASKIFKHIESNQQRIPGTPNEATLHEFVELCIKEKAPSQALNVLTYAVENSMDTTILADKIQKGFTLNEVHLAKLKSLIGDDSFASLTAI